MANVSIGGIGFDLRAYGGKFNKDVKKAMGGVEKRIGAFGAKVGLAGAGITTGLTLPLLAFGQRATKVFAGFEQEMAKVKAVSGATGAEFASLENEAKRLGSSTRFAASEVAGLQLEYSKLGFKPAEINAATEATLALAQASGSDLAESAAVAGGTLRGFQLEAGEMGRVTDVMAKSFSSSALDLTKFRESMKFVAPVANAAGVSIEESSALLSVLSDNMVSGSQAGTGLRRIMSELEGSGKPFAEALDDLAKRGLNLADAKDEVGRSAQTALLILSKNRDKVKELTAAYKDSKGAAAGMAAIMDDTTAGAGKRLASAFESLQISVGGLLAKYVTPLIEKLGVWVGKFSQLDEGTQGVIVKVGLFAAALGPIVVAVGAILAVLPALVSGVGLVGGIISAPVLAAVAVVAGAMYLVIEHKDQIIAVIMNLVNTAKQWFNDWKDKNGALLSKLSAAWSKFSTAFSALFSGIIKFVVQVSTEIVETLDGWLEPIGGLQGAFEIFATVITTIFTGILDFFGDVFGDIAEILNGSGTSWEKFLDVIISIVSNIGEALGKLAVLAWDGIKAMGKAFVDYDWAGLGKSIVDGIIKGLKDAAGALASAAKEMADNAWNAAKDALNINSPSKKFAELGHWSSVGMAKGLTDSQHLAEKAAQGLGVGVLNGTASSLGGFAAIGEEAGASFDSMFGKLESGLKNGKLSFKEWSSVAKDAVDGLSKAFGGAGESGLLGSIGSVLGALGSEGGAGAGTGGISGAISSIGGLFGGSSAGGGDAAGGSFLSSIAGLAGSFGGFFAKGGRPGIGKVSVVGENGPELLVPDTAGTVIPNSALQSGGGGASTSINVNNTYSAGVTRAELSSVIPSLQKNVMKGIVDGIARGGSFRKSIQS